MNWEPLSEQEIQSIQSIIEQIGEGYHTCGGRSKNEEKLSETIRNLAPTCPSVSGKVGDIVHLSAKPTGGTAPYTTSFNKGTGTTATLLKQITNITEAQTITYDYTTTDVDANLTQTFSVVTTDSCSGSAKQCTESCSVTIGAIVPTPTACGIPVCNLVVTVG